jgi:hypothetical protein
LQNSSQLETQPDGQKSTQPDEDDKKISALEARNFLVIANHIIRPAPRVLDPDELTPELKLIQEQSLKNWQQEDQEQRATIKARRKHLGLPPDERPLPLNYKPNGGW